MIIGWYRRLGMIVEPFLTALYATPRVALVPLILIWFGIGIWSKVFIVFINAFFPVLINTIGGVRAIDADLLRTARVFRASDWQIFTTIVIPGSVPFILTGVRQAVALGLIGVVVGEMFAGSEGIGYMTNYGGQTLSTDTVFLGVVIIAVRRSRADMARGAARTTVFTVAPGAVSRENRNMAEIVLGIGSSHGPLLSTPPEQWDLRAKADRENKSHWFRGKTYDYEHASEGARPRLRQRSDRRSPARAIHEMPHGAGDARTEIRRGLP